MITRIRIRFALCDKIKYSRNIGSVMHGVLMELIPSSYADKLHESAIHPYCQSTSFSEDRIIWTVTALNKIARDNIIVPLMSDDVREVYLRDKDVTLIIESKEKSVITYDELFGKHYMSEKTYRYIELELLSPAAFKNNGRYVIFPEAKMILGNLMRKYDSAAEATELYDDKVIEQIASGTEIVEYDLRSVRFMLEGVKIPAFVGRLTIRINGNREFICLMNMLLEYGEYSGVGIKTALGMGAYRIIGKRGAV